MKEIKLYNNLTRTKEILTPLEKGVVRLYSCGPTTYDFLHVGNARALVVGDLIYRILKASGYKVIFVRNFTDVDDKIIDSAEKIGESPLSFSKRFVEECIKDMGLLGMLPPTHSPKVSETIPQIIEMIKLLIEKGVAYQVGGEVLFHLPAFKDYGKLSKKDLENLQHGKRVEVDDYKKFPGDFVLWKPEENSEASWDSPWGKGRPGWHIECSAMAWKYLGESIDIHHGGIDLLFPHHENEIAQSEACHGKNFSQCWCHNEFLNFEKEKMSKSLGNVVTIRNFANTYGGEVLRQLLANVHYRSVMTWSVEAIRKAVSDVERIHLFVQNVQENKESYLPEKSTDFFKSTKEKIEIDLLNDFSLPSALGHFFSLIRFFNRDFVGQYKLDQKSQEELEDIIKYFQLATGLIHDDRELVFSHLEMAKKKIGEDEGKGQYSEEKILNLLEQRKVAKIEKNWERADEIRKELLHTGIEIKDLPSGETTWSYQKWP